MPHALRAPSFPSQDFDRTSRRVALVDFHPPGAFQEKISVVGLDEHLSSQRSNGVRAMIERIHLLAGQARQA